MVNPYWLFILWAPWLFLRSLDAACRQVLLGSRALPSTNIFSFCELCKQPGCTSTLHRPVWLDHAGFDDAKKAHGTPGLETEHRLLGSSKSRRRVVIVASTDCFDQLASTMMLAKSLCIHVVVVRS